MKDDLGEDAFFDEDGNLINTAWGQEEDKRQAKLEAEEAEKSRVEAKREASRHMAVEEQRMQTDSKAEQIRRRRALRDEWTLMPKWIKSMPRVPMSAPPTEGRLEKMRYSVTGKVTLTEDERKRREAALARLQAAMDSHRKIHRAFPPGTPMSPVTVISLSPGVGGSMLTRAMSKALVLSRGDYGTYAAVDLARAGSNLSRWYSGGEKERATLRHVLAQSQNPQLANLRVGDLFPPGGSGEHYLSNSADVYRRATPNTLDALFLYKFMKSTPGIGFFDCDEDNMEALTAAASMSTSVVFVLPLSREAPTLLSDMVNNMREEFGHVADEALSRSIVVVSGSKPQAATKKGMATMKALGESAAQKAGLSDQRVVVIPFDKALATPPLRWERVGFPAAHAIRTICGILVEDALDRYDDTRLN